MRLKRWDGGGGGGETLSIVQLFLSKYILALKLWATNALDKYTIWIYDWLFYWEEQTYARFLMRNDAISLIHLAFDQYINIISL